ncbi:hypothetical protein PtB15_13B128 [Puccinia triticina]|nr:hypothetical protein PtB15_13B120 [Puccinia triticina]WAR60877.1 hypothetical protein PtB15_13B124 [Puccinia triticina]WAR60880.1 hypothetical protein PtB15_13B128 [Puccinia triticina]
MEESAQTGRLGGWNPHTAGNVKHRGPSTEINIDIKEPVGATRSMETQVARLGSAKADHSQLEAKIDQRHHHQIKDLLASELARGAIWGASITALLAWGAASLKPDASKILDVKK